MLESLYRLYKNNSLKTPLEDFTTECFAGILRMENQLLLDFAINFLNLSKEESFIIRTQVKYSLINDKDCIVDIVIESNNQICFIENKVNSDEGYRQLERYSKVLNILKEDGKKTFLVYCTKKPEHKTIEDHNFRHIRWFEIAKFLSKNNLDNTIKNNFLKFKKKKMSQDLTITTKDIFVIENLSETIELLYGHLERIKPIFIQRFNRSNKANDGFSTNQILQHKRLIYYFKDIIGINGWSEIKFGFQLNSLNIYCGIWLEKKNTDYVNFRNYFLGNDHNFILIDHPGGFAIELKKSINEFINDKDGDEKILDWFRTSFDKFSEFISNSKEFNWKIID